MLGLLKLGITMLIHNKDDIKFVTELPSFLGHPVHKKVVILKNIKKSFLLSFFCSAKMPNLDPQPRLSSPEKFSALILLSEIKTIDTRLQ